VYRKDITMIPLTLTSMEAQRLLDLGRAWLAGPECLTTRRAVYTWSAATQQYARREPPPAPAAPPSPPVWAAGSAGPVPGFERVATFFERLWPTPSAPSRQLWLRWLLGAILGGMLLVILTTLFPASPPPDWNAVLRRVAPTYFSPRDDTDGWPIPTTLEGLILLDCIKPNSSGPHSFASKEQRLAILVCVRETVYPLMPDKDLPKGYWDVR
jgi:hypothetical protein